MAGYKTHWQYFGLNNSGRDFIVGDIHGYFNILRDLLKQVDFDEEKDRLFSVGDNIDRGPLSHEIVDWIGKPWFFSVLGNHEEMAIGYHKFNDWKNYPIHGGQWLVNLSKEEKDSYVRLFESMPYVFEIEIPHGKVGVVHAECPVDDWSIFKFDFDRFKEACVWNVNRYYKMENGINTNIENISFVVCGHMNVDRVIRSGNTIFLDTGAMTKKLSLLEITSNPVKIHN